MLVTIMRGLPGAGKTTYIEDNYKGLVCSSDFFRGLYDNEWNINFALLADAHDFCFDTFCKACEIKVDHIIVDNTNVTLAEMAPYRMVARRHKMTIEFVTIEPPGQIFLVPNLISWPAETCTMSPSNRSVQCTSDGKRFPHFGRRRALSDEQAK